MYRCAPQFETRHPAALGRKDCRHVGCKSYTWFITATTDEVRTVQLAVTAAVPRAAAAPDARHRVEKRRTFPTTYHGSQAARARRPFRNPGAIRAWSDRRRVATKLLLAGPPFRKKKEKRILEKKT